MKTEFSKICVLKLGSIYTLFAILLSVFVEYKISQGMWWASGFMFAMSNKFAFLILLSSVVVFGYGAYTWLGSINSFVLQSNYTTKARILSLAYLIIAPVCAAIITSEIFGVLLTNPFGDFKP